MQLNEETDALRAMGLNPIELLVVPRVIALMIALPLLSIVADAMGLAGGGLLSLVQLHIPPAQFVTRLREALSPTTFWAGLVKAPVFALLIGIVAVTRHAGARIGPRARAHDHHGSGAIHFSGDSRRCVFRRAVRTDGLLRWPHPPRPPRPPPMEPPMAMGRRCRRTHHPRAGLVNRFGRQIVHDGLNLEVRRNEIMGSSAAPGRQIGAAS